MKVLLTAIISDLKRGKFNKNKEIVTPATLSSDKLLEALVEAADITQMLDFIHLLSRTPGVRIVAKNKTVSMGNSARFAHVYADVGLNSKALNKDKRDKIHAHLQQCRFDKDQLTYLVSNLPHDHLRDLVLASQNLSRQVLIRICDDINLISRVSSSVSKLLYHTLNPDRTWGPPSVPYLDMYYFACRFGHVLGLTNNFFVELKSGKYRFETSANANQVSLKWLTSFLKRYQDRFHYEQFKPLVEAVDACENLYIGNSSDYKEDAQIALIKRYQDKKLTFISCGWMGHTVGVTLYGNHLAYRNRGEGCDPIFGGKIYKIKNLALVEDLIKDLVKNQNNAAAFEAVLAKAVDLQNPVVKLRSKPQKRGNCSFVNPKSSIMDMLLLREVGLNGSAETFVKLEASKNYRRVYKDFTKFMRNEEIDEIIKNMFYATDPDLIQFYAVLVKTYITEHHGKKRGYVKDRQEVIRAVDLFDRSTDAVQNILKADANFMVLMGKVRDEHQNNIGYFGNYQNQKPFSALVWDYKRHCDRKVSVEKGNIVAIDDTPTPKMPFSYGMAKKLIPVIGS